jgi:DNA-binding GntR family transcriptional regulator
MSVTKESVTKSPTKEQVIPPSAGPVDQVVRQLRSWIMDGSLLPGVQLRQEELADQLNVSRLPVREALRILTERELLEHRRHRGYFVARRAKDSIQQLNRMLELLEPELIRTIRWPDAKEIAELVTLNDRQAELIDADDVAGFIDLNRLFHFSIFSLSPQTTIFGEVQRLWTLIDANTARGLAARDSRRRAVTEHAGIIRALEKRSQTALLRTSEVHRTETFTNGLYP